ncbi:MAG TPA: hypothetical protein VNN80_15470 [Polyangiaceae bacterium]|nr:hypothetical protein [Polyangiaceae bacterium]
MQATILEILERAIDDSTRTRTPPVDKSDFLGLRLYGTGAIFDSMQLVNFLVLVEQMLDDDLNVNVSLTSEKAVSMRVSPFSSVKTLARFIQDELPPAAAACA